MKKNRVFLLVMALALALGMSVTGCETEPDGGTLSGKYMGDDGWFIEFTGSNFAVWEDDVKEWEGTYIVSGNTVTFTVTWASAGAQQYMGLSVGDTYTGTISGNNLTIDGETWTKQTNGGDDDVIPAKWQGTYNGVTEYFPGYTFVISANSGTFTPSGGTPQPFTNLNVQGGGTYPPPHQQVTWVYLYTGSTKMGVLVDGGEEISVRLGKQEVSEMIEWIAEHGVTAPFVGDDIPESIPNFDGDKQ